MTNTKESKISLKNSRTKLSLSEQESIESQEKVRVYRLNTSGGAIFLILRESFSTLQACLFQNDGISPGMCEYARRIPKESLVIVTGLVQVPENPIKKCTQQVEILIQEIWNHHKSVPRLPMNLDDAANVVLNQKLEDEDHKEEETKEERGKKKTIIGKSLPRALFIP